MKLLIFIPILLFISLTVKSQPTNYAIGGGIGIGSFMGNFPSQTTFGGKLFVESPSPIAVFNKIQFHITFAQKIEKFLPDSYEYDHYSYLTSIGLSGVFKQPINELIYIEEGVGLIYLNDRSFSDIDSWNFGILISLACGIPISDKVNLSLNLDYGITLNNTNSSYFVFMVKGKYHFELWYEYFIGTNRLNNTYKYYHTNNFKIFGL